MDVITSDTFQFHIPSHIFEPELSVPFRRGGEILQELPVVIECNSVHYSTVKFSRVKIQYSVLATVHYSTVYSSVLSEAGMETI